MSPTEDDPLLSQKLHGLSVYNPDLLSEEELKAAFVARTDILNRLTETLEAKQPAHTLLIGVRGMGKTTLLRRLKYAIQETPDLSKRWIPLVFPEEQYDVATLSDFYLNCLDALSDYLEVKGDQEHASDVDQFIEELEVESNETMTQAARDGIREMSGRLKRGFVLLVDNVERILDDLSEQEGWAFRELLSEEDSIVLVGATTQAVESSYKYDQPFYDFFDIRVLYGFSAEETEMVLRTLATRTETPQVIAWVDREKSRLQTINDLAGGNPRTVVLLFNLIAQGANGDVFSDLEKLLDMCTPLYKARFEELPAQGQKVLHTLALAWDPATAGEVAENARLDVTKVSSQLTRLVRQGIVQKVPLPPGKRTGFQIAERFFNIWYLMRASRRVRRRLLWLTQFLKIFYTDAERSERVRTYLTSGPPAESSVRYAEYGFALAESVVPEEARAVEYKALAAMTAATETRNRLLELLDLEGADAELKPVAERLKLLADAREQILNAPANVWPDGVSCEHFWDLLGGSLLLSASEKARRAHVVERGRETVVPLLKVLEEERERWLSEVFRGVDQDLLDCLFEAVRVGYLDSPSDSTSADAAAKALNAPSLPAIVQFCRAESDLVKSESAYRDFIRLAPKAAFPWYGLGNLLTDHLARYDDAEQAYRNAIEIDPKLAYPWNGLGNLLTYHLARYDEAEQAYRNAIEIDPRDAYPWHGLGNLLSDHLARCDEAEQAYRNAIEIDPNSSTAPDLFAWFLYQRDRNSEALPYAQVAFELSPNSAHAAHTYATVLTKNGDWESALEPASVFLTTTKDNFFEEAWTDIVQFFKEAVTAQQVDAAIDLLHKCGKTDKWRPLTEALTAICEGSTDRLQRLSPEVRRPAMQLHRQLSGTNEPTASNPD